MTKEKVLEVIGIYREHLMRLPKIDYPHHSKMGFTISLDVDLGDHNDLFNSSEEFGLAHCHGMLDQMEQFVKDDRMDKVFRWLGFVQGCLWMAGEYTLEELNNHNRPDKADS